MAELKLETTKQTQDGTYVYKFSNGAEVKSKEELSTTSLFAKDGAINLNGIKGDVEITGSTGDDNFNIFDCKNIKGDLGEGVDTVTFKNSNVDNIAADNKKNTADSKTSEDKTAEALITDIMGKDFKASDELLEKAKKIDTSKDEEAKNILKKNCVLQKKKLILSIILKMAKLHKMKQNPN